MPETSRIGIPYPSQDIDPWWDAFETLMSFLDGCIYPTREDRNLFISGGGTIDWDSGTGTLTWSSPIKIISPIVGGSGSLAAGSVTIEDGQVLYVTVTRYATTSYSLTATVADNVPSDHNALAIARRDGGQLVWRNGLGPSGSDLALSDDIVDALNGASSPSSLNPFVTQTQIKTLSEKQKEDLSDQVDGVANLFTISEPYSGDTLEVYLDGRMVGFNGNGFVETDSTLGTFTTTDVPLAGSTLIVKYHAE